MIVDINYILVELFLILLVHNIILVVLVMFHLLNCASGSSLTDLIEGSTVCTYTRLPTFWKANQKQQHANP